MPIPRYLISVNYSQLHSTEMRNIVFPFEENVDKNVLQQSKKFCLVLKCKADECECFIYFVFIEDSQIFVKPINQHCVTARINPNDNKFSINIRSSEIRRKLSCNTLTYNCIKQIKKLRIVIYFYNN
jgi:hypothetical protein